MILFPAIDIKDGKSVRLQKGDMQKCVVYGQADEMAKKWESQGAQYLHVVDLNAAFEGRFVNKSSVQNILDSVSVPVQLGGGVRTLADIEERLSMGVSRVILGTAAHEDLNMLSEAIRLFGDRIAVSLDAKNMLLSLKGWAEDTNTNVIDFGKKLFGMGVKTAVFTDISKDGMLSGVNVDATEQMIETGLNVIASGGMTTLDDVENMVHIGAYGAILGKSIYEGTIDLGEALKLC